MIRSLALGALLLAAFAEPATAQRCPPNSHAAAVAIPGNLRTAQCFCNRGFVAVNGVCVPVIQRPTPRRQPNPSGRLVAPVR
jgi:hypothetical protein